MTSKLIVVALWSHFIHNLVFYFKVVFCSMVLCGVAQAKSNLAIGQKVYEKMQEAQVHIGAKEYDQAFSILNIILEKKRLNEYERSQTISMLGNVYYQMEKFPEAYAQFKSIVEFKNIPDGFKLITLRTVSQLAFMLDKYDDALTYAKQSLQVTDKPDPSIYILIAQIYYRKEDFSKALDNTQIAIISKRKLGSTIPESWLLILNSIYYSTNAFKQMELVLQELIEFYPKKSYVLNLAAIYGQLDESKKQLLIMEPLWDQGELTSEAQLINLAHLLMLHKVPYKASLVLEQGLKEGRIKRSQKILELLSQSWQLAAEQERSIQYLAEAAKLSQKGDSYLRLGQGLMGAYRWREAETALQQAIKLGGLKKEGNTYLLLGMVSYYQKRFRSSRKTFKKAAKHPETEKLAEQWIAFVDRERQKHEAAQ